MSQKRIEKKQKVKDFTNKEFYSASQNLKINKGLSTVDSKIGLDNVQNRLLEQKIYQPYFLNNSTV